MNAFALLWIVLFVISVYRFIRYRMRSGLWLSIFAGLMIVYNRTQWNPLLIPSLVALAIGIHYRFIRKDYLLKGLMQTAESVGITKSDLRKYEKASKDLEDQKRADARIKEQNEKELKERIADLEVRITEGHFKFTFLSSVKRMCAVQGGGNLEIDTGNITVVIKFVRAEQNEMTEMDILQSDLQVTDNEGRVWRSTE